MLVGDFCRRDEQEGPFTGRAGAQLWADVKRHCGLRRQDFSVTNIIKESRGDRKLKPAEVAEALPGFLDELVALAPEVVVAAGTLSTTVLLGNVAMADVHGIPHWAEVAGLRFVVMPMYHPSASLGNKGFLSVLAYDLQRLQALLAGSGWIWEPSSLIHHTEWHGGPVEPVERPVVVGVDTEGYVDKPWGVQYCTDSTRAYVVKASDAEGLAWLAEWLPNQIAVGHNLLHDIPVLRAMGIELGEFHDTQVMAYHDIIRSGSGVLEAASQNLGTLAYRELGMQLGELQDIAGVDFNTKTIPYSPEVLNYAGDDAMACRRLYEVYKERGVLELECYRLDMGQVTLVREMMDNGIPFDYDEVAQYYTEVMEKECDTRTTLVTMASKRGMHSFNPGSHPQVRKLLTNYGLRLRKRTKGGLTSTNEKALSEHTAHPFVKQLQDYREQTKLLGTYIRPLLKELA